MLRKLFATLFVVFAISGFVFAQGMDVEAFLTETDEMIAAHAAEFDSASAEAIAAYEEAVTTQEHAHELYDAGDVRGAFGESRMARSLLGRALRMLGCPGDSTGVDVPVDRLSAEIERTDALIERVTALLGTDAPEEALELLAEATELAAEAHTAFDAGDYREAMHLIRRASALAERAERFGAGVPGMPGHGLPPGGPGGGGMLTEERVAAELDATDDVIERVTPIIEASGNADAIALLEEAVSVQADARTAFEADSYDEAMRLTRDAQRLATRAASLIPPDVPADEVLAAIEMTDEMISTATPTIEASGNEEAITILENATALQAEAHSSYDAGDYREAMMKTINARNLVDRALHMID